MRNGGANFERAIVGAADANRTAIIERTKEGRRREWTFGEIEARTGALAGSLVATGVRRGDVVMTLIGSRPEWVCALLACFRIGAVAAPCNEQLRSKDLALRFDTLPIKAVIADERNEGQLTSAAPDRAILWIGDAAIWETETVPHVDLAPEEPALLIFTSGTSGPPKAAMHGQRYLWNQDLQGRHWTGLRPGDIAWCTAGTGWSKSARNTFITPWLMGATALLQDSRFDPDERLAIVEEEGVNVLCMAPTEYRAVITRDSPGPLSSLRSTVAAGEALDADTFIRWREATGLEIRDGYGQTETGQLTSNPPDEPAVPGSMGRLLPGVEAWIEEGELVVDPATVPTFFLNYWGEDPPTGAWRTGDRVERGENGYLYFVGRADDMIISSGYRIGPTEVESALLEHPAVAEAAVVAHPDVARGSVVRAVIVLERGSRAGAALIEELQAHVREITAPYKYPRIIEFVSSLPKTATGKVRRSALRDGV